MQTVFEKINKDTAAVFFLLVVIVAYFFPMLFEDKTLFTRDLTVLVYPMKYLTYQAYHEGKLPFWNPATYGGTPFLSVMYTGVLYPLNLIFFLNDFVTAFNWFYVVHYALLVLSVYALTRQWGLSVGAALCSAIMTLLGGFFLSLPGTTVHFYSGVWLPSIFLMHEKFLKEGKMSFFLGTVICLACQILGGGPEYCILTVLTLFFWSLTQATESNWKRKITRSGIALGAVVAVSWGVTAIQLFPTYSMLGESTRVDGVFYDLHVLWSLQPSDMTSLLVPKDYKGYMYREGGVSESFSFFQSLYMGVFGVYFLCLGFLYLRQKETRFWVSVFTVGIFFALGKYNPLYHTIYDWFPLLRLFRYPEKFYLLAAFSQVFLVGYGVDMLMKSASINNTRPYIFYLLCLVLALAAGGIALAMPERSIAPSLAYLAIFGVSCYMFFSGKWRGVTLKSVLFVLIFFDLILNNYMLLPMIEKKFYETKPGAAIEINKDKDFFRLYVGKIDGVPDKFNIPGFPLLQYLNIKESLFPDLGSIYGIHYADGVSGWGLESRDQLLWTRIFHKSPPDKRLRILKRSNVKYWIEPNTVTIEDVTHKKLDVLDGALPRAFMVPTARQGKDPQLLNTYYDTSFDPLHEVLLSEPAAVEENHNPSDFAGSIEGIHYSLNQVVVQTRQNGTGFLVLLDAWFPGWTVTVDGKPEHIFRANHFYRAVRMEAGEHTIAFAFEPVGFRMGSLITEVTTVLIIFFMAWFRSKKAW